MSEAREEILARIRMALGHDRRTVAIPRTYNVAGYVELEKPVDMFVDRLTEYRANVHRCGSQVVATTITTLLSARAATDLIVPPGFPTVWLPDGLGICEGPPTVARLEACHGVITTCTVAIATTGTIILDHGEGQGARALTLVPDHHLIIVREDQIVDGVPDALACLEPGPMQTWISGPSATSDIELVRVEGVHGPRHLTVVIVTSA